MSRLCDRTEAQAWHPPESWHKPEADYTRPIVVAACIGALATLAVLIFWV